MRRRLLRAKIHRATCTATDKNYTGSITIDEDLLEAAGLMAYEQVLVANITTGTRHETYTVRGRRGKGEIIVMGAAAHLVDVGDKLIIMAFGDYDEDELDRHHANVVFVDDDNRITEIRH